MHSVRFEPTTLALVGTMSTNYSIGDADLGLCVGQT